VGILGILGEHGTSDPQGQFGARFEEARRQIVFPAGEARNLHRATDLHSGPREINIAPIDVVPKLIPHQLDRRLGDAPVAGQQHRAAACRRLAAKGLDHLGPQYPRVAAEGLGQNRRREEVEPLRMHGGDIGEGVV
jgi:hypothetical protein